MKFTRNFASTNIFGHKPSGAITFLNAKGQMVGAKKHPPTVNPPAPDANSLGAVAPSAIEDWSFATNYKGYPIDTKPAGGRSGNGVYIRVGGSVDAAKGILFKDAPSGIAYGKQLCDYWETGTVPSAPTGVVSSVPEEAILNGGGSGRHPSLQIGDLRRYHAIVFTNPDKPIHSVMAKDLDHAKEKLSAIYGFAPEAGKHQIIPHEDLVGEKRLVKEQMADHGYGLIEPYPNRITNAGTKEGFKKALDTRSATGAKNAAASAVHFKNEAKRHASGLFVKGKKPDLEKASKAANLATGAAVVADASAREADSSPAYDQAIIAHQAAADAHKHARGGVKGDHQSPSRTKEAAHLKSIEDLKGLKATISSAEPEAKKKDKLANSGTSEGEYKAWQTRRGNVASLIKTNDDASKMEPSPQKFPAYNRSTDAWRATEKAERSGSAEDRQSAADAHESAGAAHQNLSQSHGDYHSKTARNHFEQAADHRISQTPRTGRYNGFTDKVGAITAQVDYRHPETLAPKPKDTFSNVPWREANRDRSYASGSDD